METKEEQRKEAYREYCKKLAEIGDDRITRKDIIEVIAVFIIVGMVVIAMAVLMIKAPNSISTSASNQTQFNATACALSPSTQSCGIPDGMACTHVNNISVCMDFWISSNKLYINYNELANLQNLSIGSMG